MFGFSDVVGLLFEPGMRTPECEPEERKCGGLRTQREVRRRNTYGQTTGGWTSSARPEASEMWVKEAVRHGRLFREVPDLEGALLRVRD